MEKEHNFDRAFVAKFVEEAKTRTPSAEEYLFSMRGSLLLEFAQILELPDLLISQFAKTHGDNWANKHLFHEPSTYALMVRRDLVISLLEKVGR